MAIVDFCDGDIGNNDAGLASYISVSARALLGLVICTLGTLGQRSNSA